MSFKKPFRAVAVRPGLRHAARIRWERGRRTRKTWLQALAAFVMAFIGGMVFTHWNDVAAKASRLGPADACPVLSVHDGDTIRCGRERIRLANIDAPELPDSPKCIDPHKYGWCDPALGYRSRDALQAFLESGPVTIRRTGRDKYGRTLAAVSVNGRDAGAYLMSLDLARSWQ